MDIEECDILYEEINDKNKNFSSKFLKTNFIDQGYIKIVSNIRTHELIELVYCKRRNIAVLRDPVYKTYDFEKVIEHVLLFLHSHLPSDAKIWCSRDDLDELYNLGFSHPYYCYYDPFHVKVNTKIAAVKINDPHFITNARTRHNGRDPNPEHFQQRRTSPVREEETIDVFSITEENLDKEGEIELELMFNKEDLEYLSSLVYGGKTVNEDGTMSQKEVSGVLCLEMEDDRLTVKIDKTKNFNAHDEEKVRFVNGLINFHTHPSEVYDNYDVVMMYPSPSDYVSILTFLMQKYCFEDSCTYLGPMLFSVVVTMEGMYIVSLNKNYCNQEDRIKLRNTICDHKGSHYALKQSVIDSINHKDRGISGFYYGKDRSPKHFYTSHCKYIGDPYKHPLGCHQVGGFDYDTLLHNRTLDQLSHFPENLVIGKHVYNRQQQAARDYCTKINSRELITGTKFPKGPVLHVQFYTYEELRTSSFKIHTNNVKTDIIPLQTFLSEETIENIRLFY